MQKEEKTLENLSARLLAEETRMKEKEEVNNVAFKTDNNRCHICNGTGHWTRDCRNKTKQRKSVQKCENCNRIGHAKSHCR